MKIVPLILAGGKGERFWPLSRSSRPKQLLPLFSSLTMIEETLERVKKVCDKETKPLIVTGNDCAAGIKKTLPKSNSYDCIVEPVGKNTAPAIALAAAWMQKNYGDVVMLVVSADHAISPINSFVKAVKAAVAHAQKSDDLVVFGIRPTRPDVGYGYIHTGATLQKSGDVSCYKVKGFVEKPSLAIAKKYVKAGSYLWNSGMFVWKVTTILSEFQQHMPDLFQQVKVVEKANFSKKAIDSFYATCEKESIDYGIMEKSSKIAAIVGTFFWDDIGSWESMSRIHKQDAKGTVSVGDAIYQNGSGESIIFNSSNKVVAAIGLDNIVLVVTPDAVLAIAKPLLPNIKKYLGEMKDKNFPAELF